MSIRMTWGRVLTLATVAVVLAMGCWSSNNTQIVGPDVATDTPLDTPGDESSTLDCPADMAPIGGIFCMDRYEASRPDASALSAGEALGPAASVPGVLPWNTAGRLGGYEEAQEACLEAGKRLCTEQEWYLACAGPGEQQYCYGDEYEPATCNGIDAYCPDPTPFCGLEVGGFHLAPTGSHPGCVSSEGVHDINGNLWEWIEDDELVVKGGAYNCGDSAALHACTYSSPAAYRSAIGFRCCLVP